MGTYRVEWPCGCVTETQAWEPDACPMCTPSFEFLSLKAKVLDVLHLMEFATITTPSPGDAEQAQQMLEKLRADLQQNA